jgi:CHAT domain-containing protein
LEQTSLHLDTNSVQQALLFKKIGHQFQNLGKHEYARNAFQKALDINKALYGLESLNYNYAMLDLSTAYMLLIRYYEAAGMYQEVEHSILNIAGNNSLDYWHALNEHAIVYAKTRQLDNAKSTCLKALKLMDVSKHQNPVHRAIVYNNLGAVYKNQGNLTKALDAYEMSMKLAKNIPSLQMCIAANLGEVYAYLNKPKQAAAILSKYQKVARRLIADKNLVNARIWTQYGCAFAALKQFKESNRCFINAFLSNSSNIMSIDNIPDNAQQLMFENDYLATCAQTCIMMHSIEMHRQIYATTQDPKDLKKGYKIIRAMTKYGELLMDSYLSEENKLLLFKLGTALLFDRGIYFAHELYKHSKDTQYLQDAFFYAERSKSTLLVNALRSKENQSLVMLPAAEKAQETVLRQRLLELNKQKIESDNETELNTLQEKINQVNREIENFKLRLMDLYPTYFKHRYDIGMGDLKAVQQHLAKKDAVLIEYALGVQMHYVFVVTKDTLQLIPLTIDPNLDQQNTASLRKVLTDYRYLIDHEKEADSLFIDASRYFYDTYLAAALEQIETGRHLIIIPDRHLAHLPFETFMAHRPPKALQYNQYPFLLKNYPISYNYSATTMLNQQNKRTKNRRENKGILAFAASYPPSKYKSNLQSRGSSETIREYLSPLPGALKEVEMMRRTLPGTFFSGPDANEHNFKENIQQYKIIHLAMHGLLDNKHPILSSLIFTETPSEEEDNFLKAYEIAQMNIDAELVVLSACETGYGRFLQGEGVMSLAHSFSYAGASSVLMSLWQVNDYSTSKIMSNYYQNISAGSTKEASLRLAKLDYLEQCSNNITQLPAFWAAFVQTGNTAPIELSMKKKRSIMRAPLVWVVVGVGLFFFLLWYTQNKQKPLN